MNSNLKNLWTWCASPYGTRDSSNNGRGNRTSNLLVRLTQEFTREEKENVRITGDQVKDKTQSKRLSEQDQVNVKYLSW